MTRFVEIPTGTTWHVEEGEGFRVYVARIPGRGETRIEVGWDAVCDFEDAVVGRVLGQEKPAETQPEPRRRLLTDGPDPDEKPVPKPPALDWVQSSDTWFESSPWTVAWSATLRDDDGNFARWEGWYLQGPRTPEWGVPLGVGDEAPLRAAEAWIHDNRRTPEQFPGERNARRMLRRGRESGVNPTDDVSRCHLCGYASVSLDGTGDGRWVCQGGCAPDLTEIDLTGGAE